VSDGGRGTRIINILEGNERENISIEVDTSLRVESAKTEQIGPESGWGEALVGISGGLSAVLANVGEGSLIAVVAAFIAWVGGVHTNLHNGLGAVLGDRKESLGDLVGGRGLGTGLGVVLDVGKFQVVLAQLAVGVGVQNLPIDTCTNI
jgi:hypothetical protein